MAVSPQNFKFVQDLVRDTAAIVLDAGKEYLVETRLTPVARRSGFNALDDFIDQMRVHRKMDIFHERVIDAMTTNETSFYRDFQSFEALRLHVLPKLIEQRSAARRLNIWSAACSTGQEVYTIAMIIREHFPQLKDWNIQILGTDVCGTVLNQARLANYSQLEISRGMPAALLPKYFNKLETQWAVKDEVKKLAEFRRMNLIQPWPMMPAFDVIFIRNVLIYFNVETKKALFKRVRQCLQPQGFVFLGTGETTMNLDPELTPVTLGKTTVFQTKSSFATVA